MNKSANKRKKGIIATIVITGFILGAYLILITDSYYYVVCSCTAHYYPTMPSRMIGYALLISATLLFIASIWRIKKLSRWWTVPALIVFGIALYGNGYKLYYVACTPSINKVTFFTHHTTLGGIVPKYALNNADSLKAENYKGKILGYSISEKELTLYRIGDNPLKVKIRFLFWKIRPNIFTHTLSPTLHSHRNLEYEKENNEYERIGGREMPIETFLNEIVAEKEFSVYDIKNQRIINEMDGTTRYRFEIKKNESNTNK